ncbi:MAG: hypothetical protein U1F68_19515 [Gammaproteobacteria bacterium]
MKAVVLGLVATLGLAGCAVHPGYIEVTRPTFLPPPLLPQLFPGLIVVNEWEPGGAPADRRSHRWQGPLPPLPCPPGHWRKDEC